MNISDFFLGSIPLLLQFYAEMYREMDLENTMLELDSEFNVPKVKRYDFIIVGGGSAGCVLAGRLSEHFSVLLLEAGGSPPPATYVPYFTEDVGRDPSINYFFNSVPQTNAALCCDGLHGRMLGGSGSHNAMVHSRGSPKDYDNWATILNDDSFNYSNVLKYFKRMETFVGTKFDSDAYDDNYGHDGPIQVNTSIVPVLDLWFKAGRELGHEIIDPNGFQREDDDKKAYGVVYTRHGFPQIAHADKEIILSAGAFSSPLLLIKSGIGPEAVLNDAEIPVKVPLEAVGKNLGQHPSFYMTGFTVNDTTLFPKITDSETEKILAEFENGEGVLTMVLEGPQCFIVSSVAEQGWPDMWIEMHPLIRINDEEQKINFYSIIGRPKSKGTLSFDTEKYKAGIRDDVQLALIDYQFLTHPDDMVAMLDGVKFIFRILETEAFKSINLTYSEPADPACSASTFLSDDYWKCKIQRDTFAWIHMVGTCSLGPDSDGSIPTTSVVDTKFRVHGVSNLRIVDGSVIPEVTNANLNAPVLMLAEKAAEEIIYFYSGPESTTTTTTTPTTTTTRSPLDTILEPNGSKSVDSSKVTLILVALYFCILFV